MSVFNGLMKIAVRGKRLLTGRSAQTGYTKYLLEIQYKTPEELKSLQAVSLCELMTHAVNNIPYYKNLKDELYLTPERAFEDIRKFPLMNKKTIAENERLLTAENIRITKEEETSGTLGQVTKVLEDMYYKNHLTDDYFGNTIGLIPGKSRLILKDDPTKKEANTVGGFDCEVSDLRKVYRIDHRYINQKKMDFIIDLLLKKKPSVIWGDSYAATVIARYISDNNIEVPSPEFMILGAQMLLPKYRKEIEEVFKTDVYDRYGSTETGNTANQCRVKNGYHYVPVTHYIEVLDNEGNPVDEGERGNLIITTLNRRGKPFIRYDIGDLVVYTKEKCSCGSNFPIIKEIDGKIKEGVISPIGTYMNVGPLGLLLGEYKKIIDFQMIQIQLEKLQLRFISSVELSSSETKQIIEKINWHLDYPMVIEINYCDELIPMPTGKVLRVIPYNRYIEIKEYLYESL